MMNFYFAAVIKVTLKVIVVKGGQVPKSLVSFEPKVFSQVSFFKKD